MSKLSNQVVFHCPLPIASTTDHWKSSSTINLSTIYPLGNMLVVKLVKGLTLNLRLHDSQKLSNTSATKILAGHKDFTQLIIVGTPLYHYLPHLSD